MLMTEPLGATLLSGSALAMIKGVAADRPGSGPLGCVARAGALLGDLGMARPGVPG